MIVKSNVFALVQNLCALCVNILDKHIIPGKYFAYPKPLAIG